MRVGVAFQSRTVDLNAMLSQVTLTDELGYDSVWITETWGYDAFLLLHEIAKATRRVKLGTGVVNVYSRSPATLAMAYATLNELSHDRAILGLGTSGASLIEQWHGVKYEKPLERMRESVAVIKQVLSGNPLNHEGEIFNVKHFRLGFKPSQSNHRA